MAVTSRATLTEYCLRALGEPVVEINVDDSQLEERIDEALDYWNQYHFDGAERMYLKQKITASAINITTDTASDFDVGAKITGSTSGATAVVCSERDRVATGYQIICKDVTHTGTDMSNAFLPTPTSTFLAGETITSDTGATAVIDVTGVLLGTYDLHYFPLPDFIYGVTRVCLLYTSPSPRDS